MDIPELINFNLGLQLGHTDSTHCVFYLLQLMLEMLTLEIRKVWECYAQAGSIKTLGEQECWDCPDSLVAIPWLELFPD